MHSIHRWLLLLLVLVYQSVWAASPMPVSNAFTQALNGLVALYAPYDRSVFNEMNNQKIQTFDQNRGIIDRALRIGGYQNELETGGASADNWLALLP